MSRILIATTIIIATLGFVKRDKVRNSMAQDKEAHRALCHDKIGDKHVSNDPMKAEWKNCMKDTNAYQ